MKRNFTIALCACISVLVLGSLQVFVARTQTDSLANLGSAVNRPWQPETWKAAFWTGPNKWHSCSMNSTMVYTRFAGWNGLNSWGNTEYERGRDPWKSYGKPSGSVPLTTKQRLTVSLRVVENKVDVLQGIGNAYVDLWVNFSEPVGNMGLRWAELIIYLKTEKGIFYPFQEQGSFSSKICKDGNLRWYMIGYSCFDVGSEWSTRTIAVNDLISRLSQVYGVVISKGTVSCVTFGVEAAQGEMAVEWSSLNYDYEL